MQFSDKEIHDYLAQGKLLIVAPRKNFPFDADTQVQPASIDLRLDARITTVRPEVSYLDVGNVERTEDIESLMETKLLNEGDPIPIPARGIVFGQVYEQLRLPNDAAGRIEGRSRVARLGIAIHATGDFINPGWEGAMPLQLINHNAFPVVIYPYMSICQLVLYRLTNEPLISYGSRVGTRYHKQYPAGPSVLHEDVVLQSEEYNTIGREEERQMVAAYRRDRLRAREMSEARRIASQQEAQLTPGVTVFAAQIGAINVSSVVQQIGSNLNTLSEQQDTRVVSQALAELLEAIQSNRAEFRDEDYADFLQQLEEVSEQAAKPADQPKKLGVLHACLDNIGRLASTAEKVHVVWEKWGPVLSGIFATAGS